MYLCDIKTFFYGLNYCDAVFGMVGAKLAFCFLEMQTIINNDQIIYMVLWVFFLIYYIRQLIQKATEKNLQNKEMHIMKWLDI